MSLLPGVNRLEALIEAQNTATEQHRAFEGESLRTLESEVGEIKTLAQTTNGRVNQHDIQLALIKRDEEQALTIEAARVKAEEAARASHVSLKQGLEVAAFSLLGGGVVTAVIYLALGLSTK